MATNPRKFSEKIALHNQKQKEETEAFEKVMKDVTTAVRPTCEGTPKYRDAPQYQGSRNGFYHPASTIHHRGRSAEPRKTTMVAMNQFGSIDHSQTCYSYQNSNDNGGVTYLSPPNDGTWRRTHSDSALNASLEESASPCSQRRQQLWDDSSGYGNPNNLHLLSSSLGNQQELRQKHLYDMGSVPGINVNCPLIREVSPNGSSLQIPNGIPNGICNNTGSLPDLTIFTNHRFDIPSSPIPIMVDRDQPLAHSPYSTSPRLSPSPGVSPRRLSPYPHPHSPGASPSRGSSPGPVARRRHAHHPEALIFNGPRGRMANCSPQPPHQSQNRLGVPSYSSANHSISQCLTAENSPQMTMPFAFPCPSEEHPSLTGMNDQGGAPHRSPPEYRHHSVHVSPAQSPTQLQGVNQVRVPMIQRRATHPYSASQYNENLWLTIPNSKNYRSGSPADNSAPPSPLSQSLSPASSPGIAASPSSPFSDNGHQGGGSNGSNSDSGIGGKNLNPGHHEALQRHFENFNMNDPHGSGSMRSGFNPMQVPPGQSASSHNQGLQMDLSTNFSLDGFVQTFEQSLNSRFPMQTAPQTPQTPSSIPDINVQDYSVDDFNSALFASQVAQAANSFCPDLGTDLDADLDLDLDPGGSSDLAASVCGFNF